MYLRGWLAAAPTLLALLISSVACVDLTRPALLGPKVTTPPGDAADAPSDPPDHDGPDSSVEDDGPGEPEVAPEIEPPADIPPPPDAADVKPPTDTGPPPGDGGALGSSCTAPGACSSGLCVDGICCESTCNSACYTCKVPGNLGKCVPVGSGIDPDNECAPGACAGSTETAKSTCDGAGACRPGAIRECAPYLCGAGACRSTCTVATDCKAGYVCSTGMCVVMTADAGVDTSPPPAGTLTVDDFSDGSIKTNSMGGAVTWDNQSVALVAGQLRFTWNNNDSYQDFIETFLPNFCGFDLRMYKTLRFKMRASAGPRSVRIFYTRSTGGCNDTTTPVLTTVTITTTMNTYDVDLTNVTRDKGVFFEWAPSTLDSTDYFIDDIQLVP